jgi:hypothetical protein
LSTIRRLSGCGCCSAARLQPHWTNAATTVRRGGEEGRREEDQPHCSPRQSAHASLSDPHPRSRLLSVPLAAFGFARSSSSHRHPHLFIASFPACSSHVASAARPARTGPMVRRATLRPGTAAAADRRPRTTHRLGDGCCSCSASTRMELGGDSTRTHGNAQRRR